MDNRWQLCRRPAVVVGGELTLETLDLIYSETARFYEAPFQVKANGGMLLIDDFGRQKVHPTDLLNRWIVPLEKRVDFLTLHTGKKFEIPFDQLVVFSTNLDPKELVDEAFLRRIKYKIEVGNPDEESFREIFRRVCEAAGIPYVEQAVTYLFEHYYKPRNMELRACHPRDLVAPHQGRRPLPADPARALQGAARPGVRGLPRRSVERSFVVTTRGISRISPAVVTARPHASDTARVRNRSAKEP